MTDWLVTGGAGMLGRAMRAALAGRDAQVLTRTQLDVLDRERIRDALKRLRPRTVINAAANAQVDEAELDPSTGYRINALAPGYLAEACVQSGAAFIHLSTDYVFDGSAGRPYRETDAVGPLMRYGQAKAAGETAALRCGGQVYVVRTCRMYAGHGPSFVRAIGCLAQRRRTIDVVDSQTSAPVWAPQLAARLVVLGRQRPEPGVYHCTSAGSTSLYHFARAIMAELGADPDRIRPAAADSVGYPAPRPRYSVLSNGKWRQSGLPPIPDWRDCLLEAFRREGGALVGEEAAG
jgi:dTDP-4-dehydrorhamnose reductase